MNHMVHRPSGHPCNLLTAIGHGEHVPRPQLAHTYPLKLFNNALDLDQLEETTSQRDDVSKDGLNFGEVMRIAG